MSKKYKEIQSRHWSAKPGKMERVIYNEIITNEERKEYAKQMLHMDANTYWLKYRNEQLEQQLDEANKKVGLISLISYIIAGVLALIIGGLLALM